MSAPYQFLPGVFLRAPYYSFRDYDLLRLPEVLNDPVFRNAIRLASPVFLEALAKKDFDFGRLSAKEKHTLAKYYNRMSFRPTPFGAFSTFTLLQWGDDTAIRLGEALLHLLPDQSRVAELDRLLRGAPAGRLVLNPTIYTLGREIRFIRSEPDEKGHYRFSLESVAQLPFYTELFRFVREARPTPGELRAQLIILGGCSPEEAADYLDFLLDSRLLFDASAGRIIGDDRYRDLEKTLPAAAELPPGAFYAAAERPCPEGGPDTALQQELGAAIAALGKLVPPAGQTELDRFRLAFEQRFDRERVPLLRALDPDAGIPYGELGAGPEEEDLPAPVTRVTPALDWDPVRRLLLSRWQGERPIVLTEADLADLPAQGPAPSTLSVLFRRTEAHLLIEYAGGATGTNLCGRFSVFSPGVEALCRDIAAREQAAHPELLFADIAQLSDTHTDNINRRRPIYGHGIAVNTYADPGDGRQLALDDLYLSVRQGELVLESGSQGKRVIPRLATAYNYRRTELGVFRLLCDLQYQGLRPVRGLDLEAIFPGLPFYPRVVYGQTVLSPAKWRLNGLPRTAAELRAFREKHRLPQRVSMGSSDQLLVFDLAVPEEAAFFTDCIRGQDEVLLQEYLLPDRSVRKGLCPLAGQFAAHLWHEAPVCRPLSGGAPAHSVPRHFPIGSEWLYFKLYCTPRAADTLLREVIAPLVEELRPELPCWFFIRYNEGGHHLRLRFRTKATGRLARALREKLAPYEELVRALQADTYQRELERYGAALIADVETLFCLGSELYLRSGGGLPVALGMIQAWCGPEQAIAFTARLSESFMLGFGGTKALRAALDRRYRERKAQVAASLAESPDLGRLLAQLRLIKAKGAPEHLLADLVHMQLNRSFTEDPRRQEMIAYHHLHKYLVSRKARPL